MNAGFPLRIAHRSRSVDAVCVVIPAFNEEPLIGRCIQSVLAAGLRPSQIFVLDDRSADSTAAVAAGFAGINVVRHPRRMGKMRSIERGILSCAIASRFEFMATLDADSYVMPEYFDAALAAFDEDPRAVLVCGTPRSERANWLTAYRTLDYAMSHFVYRQAQDVLGVITVAPGCASTYRTSILGALDWGGGTLVEDMDLTIQIHRKRLGRVRYAKDAVTMTQDPRTIRDYLGQITRWYSGTWQVARLHRLPWGRQLVDLELGILLGEGLLYSVLFLSAPVLAFFWPERVLVWMLLDQGVVLAGAAICAVHQRRLDVLVYAPLYGCLRVLNCATWLMTFWREVVRRRALNSWFSVARYGSSTAGRSS
jgi:cellulose synthase/poly-beta-1,6-N-acetylglucosamine synthase-like glycosyltransferase